MKKQAPQHIPKEAYDYAKERKVKTGIPIVRTLAQMLEYALKNKGKWALCLLLAILTSCATLQPVCRHNVLRDYALASEHYAEVGIVHIKNPTGSEWKYHAAVRVLDQGEWVYVFEEKPAGIILNRYTAHEWLEKLESETFNTTGAIR